MVSSYLYLGINFNTSLQGNVATAVVIIKNKVTLSTVPNILRKLKSDAWAGKVHAYNSMSQSMLLYLAHLWCLNPSNIDKLESAYLMIYKKFFSLPLGSTNYAIRIEFDIEHIALKILSLALNRVCRVLKMGDDRLPKICLLHLIALTKTPFNSSKHNWAQKLRHTYDHHGKGNS